MAIAEENLEIRKAIQELERRIDQMHLDFDKYVHGRSLILSYPVSLTEFCTSSRPEKRSGLAGSTRLAKVKVLIGYLSSPPGTTLSWDKYS